MYKRQHNAGGVASLIGSCPSVASIAVLFTTKDAEWVESNDSESAGSKECTFLIMVLSGEDPNKASCCWTGGSFV